MKTGMFNALVRFIVTICFIATLLAALMWRQGGEVAALALTSDNASSVGNSFTYQGMLTDSGAPATGLYDFRFQLLDEAMVVLAQLDVNDVVVTNGLFTTAVPAGNSLFTGERRLLKVATRKDGENDYVELGEATEIKATPYALHAVKAGSANFADEAAVATTLKSGKATVVQVGTFDMAESDGANTLTFAAKGTGRLEVKRPGGIGTAFVYVPVDVPTEVVGMTQKLTALSFCYSGKADNGVGVLAGIEEAGVRQMNQFAVDTLINEVYTAALSATDECINLLTATPLAVNGSLWVRFKLTASPVALEFGEIKLTFVSEANEFTP